MYLHGCNYPWSTDGTTVFYGMDFGANVWGSHLGVSTRRDEVARDFAEMARLGFTAARWFLFCDGRAGIIYGERVCLAVDLESLLGCLAAYWLAQPAATEPKEKP